MDNDLINLLEKMIIYDHVFNIFILYSIFIFQRN